MRIFLKTLGCPKNTADSGRLLGFLSRYGIGTAASEAGADAVIINTCSFIKSATEESLEEIFSASGTAERVIVTGCMTGRYGKKLEKMMPEVEAFIPIGDLERFPEVLLGRRAPRRTGKGPDPLAVLTPVSTCYVKISEGCDRRCAFCAIPSIRGRQVSRPASEIVSEVMRRVEAGVSEVVLVGQDVAAYGRDSGGSLESLLKRLVGIRGRFVVRLLYLYPSGLTRRLTDFILREEKICSYFDIPFQHSSKMILRLMRRSYDRSKLLGLTARIRREDPDAGLRATVMVGFPGEGEAEFADLVDFVKSASFDHLGVFKFSPEEGTAADGFTPRVGLKTMEKREAAIMDLQRGISGRRLSRFRGRILDGWVDEPADAPGVYLCRNSFFAPEIDGAIWTRSAKKLKPGARVRLRVVKTGDYDLYAEVA